MRLGSRTLSEFFTSSTCVHSVLLSTCEFNRPFQTELAIDTNIVVANTNTVVENTQAVVTGTQRTVADTRVVVADTQTVVTKIEKKVEDIHRDVLAGRGDASGQNGSVGVTFHPQTADCLSLPRLKPGQ